MRDRAEDARESTAEELTGDVVTLDSWIHRVTGAPMEPRAVIGEHDPSAGRHTLRTSFGRGVVQTRARLAATLGVPVSSCRAVFGDVGGNFGSSTRSAMP